jgi:hypothetical protein
MSKSSLQLLRQTQFRPLEHKVNDVLSARSFKMGLDEASGNQRQQSASNKP